MKVSLLTAQTDHYSVYLIGDAGEYKEPGKALLLLKEKLLSEQQSAVIFLGDNAYPSGLRENDRETQLHLESQLQILKEYKGQAYFIPGNHDWAAQKSSGARSLALQEKYVEEYLSKTAVMNPSTAFRPAGGLPGPETVMLNDKLRVIFLDTQWFLHAFKKNGAGSKRETRECCYARLDSTLRVAKGNNEQVLIAAHHPIYSNGKHSRSLQPLRFLVNYTPFQVFGLMGLNRLFSQDLPQPKYKRMRKRLMGILDRYDNVVYACGHEHNLQFFRKNGTEYIVSGSGSKVSALRKKRKFDSVYQDDTATGFFKLEFDRSGIKKISVYQAGKEAVEIK